MKNFTRFCRFFVFTLLAALSFPLMALSAELPAALYARSVYSDVNGLIKNGNARMAAVSAPWYAAPNAAVRKTSVKFYFTEKLITKGGFPETAFTLRKAVVTHQFSDREPMKVDEYYFSSSGNFVFYYCVSDVTEESLNTHFEFRYYYGSDGRLARAIDSQRPLNAVKSKMTFERRDSNFTPDMKSCSEKALKKMKLLRTVFDSIYGAGCIRDF